MTETRALEFQKRVSLQQLEWGRINEPGAYVEIATGTLYRVPEEALLKGTAPSIRKHGAAGSRFLKVSNNPFIFSLAARTVCVEHNIRPNF